MAERMNQITYRVSHRAAAIVVVFQLSPSAFPIEIEFESPLTFKVASARI